MRTYSKLVTFLILNLLAVTLFSQEFAFHEAPEFYQLYARDHTDIANVEIKGVVKGMEDVDKLSLKVFRDGHIYNQKTATLTGKRFSVSSQIDAGLHQYRFELYLEKNGQDSLIFKADSVVCGDAYVITGQSNSHASSSLSTYSSPYCRSFGVKTGYEKYNEQDRKVRWGRATGNCPGLKGVGGWFTKIDFGVGVWGMELMRLIVEQHKIPVCIINGGSGSSSIEANMLYPEIPSLETSFGRLAYRVDQAGLKDGLKAILWHQGESNSRKQYKTYTDHFDVLLNDWKRVYTGLEKVYLFQLHPGCGGEYQSQLREIQCQIADRYDMVDIMSTTGVTGHDGCHFSYEGYCEFASRIFPLVSRDFYGAKYQRPVTPPKLLKARYQKRDEIVLEFDQPVLVEEESKVNGTVHDMKDQFFFRKDTNEPPQSGVVKRISVEENRIILSVKDSDVYNYITWLPNKNYPNTQDVYSGPWIRGSKNQIGALSFHNRPVSKSPAFINSLQQQ